MLDIGLPSRKSLFQIEMERLGQIIKQAESFGEKSLYFITS